ncbi:hypothetical protein [Allonocardiopsis opalescens]|uniref:Uncharacterized protein n=1 Tax=Allonocardiopsis opalescens TaxID=1144618 RepID=A0A2T0PPK2_9ACTN|nr:hypothetical protein [Allonocardiopsis opalescens]PRX90807.1 hypothetical protein CLV72_1163 [Allonocardiopsis opalescens]
MAKIRVYAKDGSVLDVTTENLDDQRFYEDLPFNSDAVSRVTVVEERDEK